MGRIRMNWRQDLSAPRLSAQDMAAAQLKVAGLTGRAGTDPLVDEARQAAIARAQSAEAKATYNLQKEIETDRQKTAFYNGLQELETNLRARGMPIGTQGHAEAFAAYAHEFPLARSASDVVQTLKLHALVNDDQAALAQRLRDMSPPPEKIAQRYATVKGNVSQYEQALTGDIERQKQSNIQAKAANVPYNPVLDDASRKINAALQGSKIEAAQLETMFPQLAPQQQDTTQAVAPQAAPAATPVPNATPTPTPVHLGRYNPQTGEFE